MELAPFGCSESWCRDVSGGGELWGEIWLQLLKLTIWFWSDKEWGWSAAATGSRLEAEDNGWAIRE